MRALRLSAVSVEKKVAFSEQELIARFFAPISGSGGLGLQDDAALVSTPYGYESVLTSDALIAGVHFFAEDAPASIARKALAVNLSDLAAKGARPAGFLLTLALPNVSESWLTGFAQGLKEISHEFSCPLLGGDTVRTPGPLMISIMAIGHVQAGEMVLRGKAQDGDHLCITGTIGDSALGLALRSNEPPPWARDLTLQDKNYLLDRYLHPVPRLGLIDSVRRYARSSMDISDGLAGDLATMLGGKLTAQIDNVLLPFSKAGQNALKIEPSLFDTMVTGGDDYELLLVVPPGHLAVLSDQAQQKGIRFTRIGQVLSGAGLPSFHSGKQKKSYPQGAYSHF